MKDTCYTASARRHWPVDSRLNLRRYNFISVTITCPPVVSAAPEKRSSNDWDSPTVSIVGVVVYGAICMMVELSTNQYPTSFRELWDIQHLKTAACPASWSQLIIVVLTIDRISGFIPFTCPRPCWGGGVKVSSHLSPT